MARLILSVMLLFENHFVPKTKFPIGTAGLFLMLAETIKLQEI